MSPWILITFVLVGTLRYPCVFSDGFTDNQADVSAIRYQLYTRINPGDWQTVKLNDVESLARSNFNPGWITKIYAIGWDNDGSIANDTKREYLIASNYNFFVVDWKVVQPDSYSNAINITKAVGFHLAEFVDFLVEHGKAPIGSFHLIGHSAGVILSAVAASAIQSGKLSRITGLDPVAGRYLNMSELDLHPSDADFVDVVHTTGGDDYLVEPMGHVDFYVNGALQQPGCERDDLGTCCSHCRATDLFAESINTRVGFRSVRCDSYVNFKSGFCSGNEYEMMGEHVNLSARGFFYVNTNGKAPWALG